MASDELKPYATAEDLILFAEFVSLVDEKINRNTRFDNIVYLPLVPDSEIAIGVVVDCYSLRDSRGFQRNVLFRDIRGNGLHFETFVNNFVEDLNDYLVFVSVRLVRNKLSKEINVGSQPALKKGKRTR